MESEIIVINLVTGAYFSLRGAAADAWDLLIAGLSTSAVATQLADRYAVPADGVTGDIAAFARELLAEGLVVPGGQAPVDAPTLDTGAPALAYTAPRLEKFDDLEELLLLDPIHEVDEAGWPVIAAEPTDL